MRFLAARRRHGLLSLALAAALSLTALPGLAQADRGQVVADALASLSTDGLTCTTPALTQPFASFGDENFYVPVPGQWTEDSTATDGWLLQGGASIQSATLQDGSTGRVLDLPSRSFAISPPVCVDLTYPTARLMVRNVNGGGGVHAFVSYLGPNTWGKPRDGGSVHGRGPDPQGAPGTTAWTLSDPIHLQPSQDPGWQLIRFGLVPDGKNSEFQIYNFYADPYARR